MIRLAIVDDSKEITEIIEKYIKKTVQRSGNAAKLDIVKYCNPMLLTYDLQEQKTYEIYFLDIEMPQMSGMELAQYIRKKQGDAYIIFITSHVSFAIMGYDRSIKAFGYVLKDKLAASLPEVINNVLQELVGQRDQYYTIHTTNRFQKVKTADVIRIYRDGKNAIFVMKTGDTYRDRKPLTKLIGDLNDPRFLLAERGSIVNIEHIDKITYNQIYMDNEDIVDVNRAKASKVKQKVNSYWSENI